MYFTESDIKENKRKMTAVTGATLRVKVHPGISSADYFKARKHLRKIVSQIIAKWKTAVIL